MGISHFVAIEMNRSRGDQALIDALRRKIIELEKERKDLLLQIADLKFRRKMDIERSETKPIVRSQSNTKGKK